MKVLLIAEEYIVRVVNGKYYHQFLTTHIERYSVLGDITLCTQMKTHSSNEGLTEIKDVSFARIYHSNSISSLLKNNKKNKQVIRTEVQKADIVIGYVPSFLSNYALKCAKKEGKPTLMVAIACPWDALWNHSVKGKLMAPIAMIAMKKCMQKTDAALYVTSKFLQHRYPTKGIEAGISDVVLRDVDINILEKRLAKIKDLDLANKSTEIKIITSAAIYVKYKRQEDVIKAIAVLKEKYNLHYYLAGYGDNSYLARIAEKLGVSNRVHFLGMLNHDELFNTLEEMDLYIQPSKQEGLPRALVEAMSMALPAIGSNAGGIPELLQYERIFRKGNAQELSLCIENILHTDQLMESAIYNFEKAKEFTKVHLDERRKAFLEILKTKFDINKHQNDGI